MLQGRGGKLALVVSAVGVLLWAGAEYNQAAACRGAGAVTTYSDGTSLTKWSDGAYIRTEKDGSFEWAYPSGSDPVPGASPGHNPLASPGHKPY
jgi:hypothetical protein